MTCWRSFRKIPRDRIEFASLLTDMNCRKFLRIVVLALASLGLGGLAKAADLPAAEKTKIESLISHLETLGDAKFIRNGSEYDAKMAAKFLRGKWEKKAKEIASAKDFIDKAATKSDMSGKPYMIQLKGQPATPCGSYLKAELEKLEK